MPSPITRTTTTTSPTSFPTAARQWAETFRFDRAATIRPLEVPRPTAATTGPTALRRAYALYRSWEDNDLGSVRLLKTEAAGQRLYALHTTTDGDDGFLELYNGKGLIASGVTGVGSNGQREVRWDASPGQVRDRVAPREAASSITSFHQSVDRARKPSSPSRATVNPAELKGAAAELVGTDLTTQSVDGFEKAALLRTLADPDVALTQSSRAFGQRLSALYANGPAPKLTARAHAPLGTTSAFTRAASLATARNTKANPVGMRDFVDLSRLSWDLLPAQVVPLSRREAQAHLKSLGASTIEARTAVESLAGSGGVLFAGRLYEQGADWTPRPKGVALFGVSADRKSVKALHVPVTSAPSEGADARQVVQQLLGVDREVEVKARRTTAQGQQLDLAWRAPSGLIEGRLDVPADGTEPTLHTVTLRTLATDGVLTNLAARLETALGAPQQVLGAVGRDTAQGVGFVAAHRPAAGGPLTLSTIRIDVGGESATVTAKSIGTSAADAQLARDVAAELVKVHAESLVADPSLPDAARLEVALRTRWLTGADLQPVPAADSPVGFDSTKERLQFTAPSVWGDNAVFVTFAKNGGVRLEDVN